MTVSGVRSPIEQKSGGATAPEGLEYAQCYIAEHVTLRGLKLINAATDFEELVGAGELADDLRTAKLNANGEFYAGAYFAAPGSLTDSSVAYIVAEIAKSIEVSTLIFLIDADLAFANAVKAVIIEQGNLKTFYQAILRTRRQHSWDLSGIEATQAAGKVTIPIANSFGVGDEVQIDNCGDLGGRYALSDADGGSIEFAADAATFTCPDGASIEEHLDDYFLDLTDIFELFISTSVSIVAPTDQAGHATGYAGRIARIPVKTSPAKTLDGGIENVATNPNLNYSHVVLADSARLVLLKRHAENMAEVHVNDDNVLFGAADDVKTMATRRVIDKAKRNVLFHSFKLIQNEMYARDEDGARAAGNVAAAGLEVMRKSGEIHDYDLSVQWLPEGGFQPRMALTDVHRIKYIVPMISITQQTYATGA